MDPSRISIRPFKLSDIDDYMVWASDEKMIKDSKMKAPSSQEDALRYLKEVAIPHPWCRSICIDDRSIGLIIMYPGSNEFICKGEVGYTLASEYGGQGIATMALKLALSSVFVAFPHMERLQALCNSDNISSQRVLQKAGFTKEGVLRKYIVIQGKTMDSAIYSFLSTDSIPSV